MKNNKTNNKTIDEIKQIIRRDKDEKITKEVLRCIKKHNFDLEDAKKLCSLWGLIDEEIRI
jgi:hypothetical protein